MIKTHVIPNDVMNYEDAITALREETMSSGGVLVLLRLAEDPGMERILHMRKALRIVWRKFITEPEIPHEIAFICGMFIHFSRECRDNLRGHPQNVHQRLVASVDDLALGAFEVLAGDRALEWTRHAE